MNAPIAALTLPSALERLKAHVLEDVSAEDVSGQEVVDTLTIAWMAAERWRIERATEVDEVAEDTAPEAREAGA